jgi:hypothetical protein
MDLKALIPELFSKNTSSTSESTTIMKSKMFILSLMYSTMPNPINFKTISIVNTIVNTVFSLDIIFSS